MAHSYKYLTEKALDFWLARGAILAIVILQIIIVNDLSVGPRWLAPVLELALLIPLSIATVWTQRRARKASTDAQWNLVGRQRLMMRRLAISLTALVTLVNFGATTLTGLSVLGVPAGGFTIGAVPGPLQPGQAASLNWSFAGGASPPASFRITTDDPQVSATVNLVQQ